MIKHCWKCLITYRSPSVMILIIYVFKCICALEMVSCVKIMLLQIFHRLIRAFDDKKQQCLRWCWESYNNDNNANDNYINNVFWWIYLPVFHATLLAITLKDTLCCWYILMAYRFWSYRTYHFAIEHIYSGIDSVLLFCYSIVFCIAQIVPLSFQAAVAHKTKQVRWGELHAPVVTEWSSACLHK